MDLGLVLWFLIRKEVNLDEWIRQARGPISWGQLAALDNLQMTINKNSHCILTTYSNFQFLGGEVVLKPVVYFTLVISILLNIFKFEHERFVCGHLSVLIVEMDGTYFHCKWDQMVWK